jgi:phosphonate transport system permease protein
LLWLALSLYVLYALTQMGVSAERVWQGLGHAGRFVAGFFPPNFERGELLLKGLLESLQIAFLASFFGTLLAIPLALLAARNLMPSPVSWSARLLIILCRSFHPVILAIIAVKAVGFGALAGVMALTVASVGFVGKLLAEAIEEVSMKQVEAVRATGAGLLQQVIYAIVPQVLARFVGFCTYETDANLRNSTMVGVVGAGGIGGTLFAAFQRFDYDFVAAIILCIIAIILLGEMLQLGLRKMFQ